ncbi:MAG: translational GTPase TypA [Peptococcaceae bacterium]|jgi:GTP-binding protein|nr:translational GTPase TypA [Peptococcaceae bacterium]MBQ2014800.1 translational GTPase TypA [Peptococcaceae bacterium]MBQ2448843.1 translational GTPase TypA [Peptococcaceae bacterium]MBQ5652752.1 translational GTPase TypA [Peptococcaceae bacterium]MBQ5683413.1 translational GTPase TypA [Peptococcaceae bacterium]
MKQENIRNIAIIAHVDHGKTTLVDKLLSQSGTFRENEQVADRVMDSGDLEREKGITILAKNTAITYGDYKINIVDTPGHADFGGEVERIMKMVDGVLLVVDAFEGCMPQTRFVLKKALEQKLTPIVVINKMDREFARPLEVIDEVIDLFIDLGADEDQLEFPVIFASGIAGIATDDLEVEAVDLKPLYKAIIEHIPSPKGDVEGPLQAQITLMDYNDFLGRIAVCTINRGTVKTGQMVAMQTREGKVKQARISKLFGFQGLKKFEIESASVGEIVAIAGLGEINVGETICDPANIEPMEFLKIEEPTLEMSFMVNNSPFAGKDGDPVTSRKLSARLFKEMETDIALKVTPTDNADTFKVAGRGELHLSILIETMRREGMEFQVSKPQVVIKDIDGVKCEPYEALTVDVPEEYMGPVMEKLGIRKGEMTNMQNFNGQTRLEYIIPARGLVGFRTEFLTDTRGYGIMNSVFDSYRPYSGNIVGRRTGALLVFETGTTTAYGLFPAEERGTLFIGAGMDVYEGMIIGEGNREQDIAVNVCKGKNLTNVRASSKDDTVRLKTPRDMSLEECIAFLNDDEYLEVTPNFLRLRKRFLKAKDRVNYAKQQQQANQ